MAKFNKILVVGFDGLDYEKIQKYEYQNLMLESFGKMDTLGLDLKTPQLWASVITGELPRVHGVDDMLVFKGEKAQKLSGLMDKVLNPLGMAGLHLKKCLNYYLFDSSITVPDKEFLKVDTVFDRVPDAKGFDIPGYSEYPYISGKMNVAKLSRKHPPVSLQRVKRDIDAEHLYRKTQLFDNIGEHRFLMQHFHYSDWHQHMYLSKEKDEELYREMDELAGEILEKVDEATLVVFCSDHGLEGGGHRDQAFYAVNTEIEGSVTLTNILDKCLEKVDMPQKDDVGEIEF